MCREIGLPPILAQESIPVNSTGSALIVAARLTKRPPDLPDALVAVALRLETREEALGLPNDVSRHIGERHRRCLHSTQPVPRARSLVLRHRLLVQSGGVEGFGAVCERFDSHQLCLTDPAGNGDRCRAPCPASPAGPCGLPKGHDRRPRVEKVIGQDLKRLVDILNCLEVLVDTLAPAAPPDSIPAKIERNSISGSESSSKPSMSRRL